ncbi:MAG: type II toxin-antitoxin system VapC family toxin [Acidimicrobiia bacterium]
MSLVLDTGPLYAWYDRSDRWHEATRALFVAEPGALLLPAPVISEVDYLLGTIGSGAREALYSDLVEGQYLVATVSPAGYARIQELNARYRSLELGFVDAAVMAIAEERGVARVATTDRRDFSAVELSVPLDLLP